MPTFTTTGVAAGGRAVARAEDGRVVFLAGALPQETVEARIVRVHRRHLEAETVAVLAPSPLRVTAPCAWLGQGCGGCDWQAIDPQGAMALRRSVVVDCLNRLGGVAEPRVAIAPPADPEAGRTTLRLLVENGRAGFRHRRSHAVSLVDSCMVAHPLAQDLLGCDFGAAVEATVRVGARTGERLVMLTPTAAGARFPADVRVVGADALDGGKRAWIYEEIRGRRVRVSARAFFQARPDVLEAMLERMCSWAAEATGGAVARVVDLYGGVGVMGGAVAEHLGAARLVCVEGNAAAAADARVNFRLLAMDTAVVCTDAIRWRAERCDLLVADPPRAGLGRAGVATVKSAAPRVLLLVSCDPAALGRDTSLLGAAGFRHVESALFDMFPRTSHVEALSLFCRRP